MLTAKIIKEKAKELGAVLCGIGDIKYFEGDDFQRNPLSILPNAKCIIGCALPVPKGFYKTMESESQFYTYTSMGVKYIDETFAEIFLLKLGNMIEDEGYDACLQRNVPGMRIKGDKTTNPEVKGTYELQFASPVEEGKPAPDVIIDTNKAARVCGLGSVGLHGKVITPEYGTYLVLYILLQMHRLNVIHPLRVSFVTAAENVLRRAREMQYQLTVWIRGSAVFITEVRINQIPL